MASSKTTPCALLEKTHFPLLLLLLGLWPWARAYRDAAGDTVDNFAQSALLQKRVNQWRAPIQLSEGPDLLANEEQVALTRTPCWPPPEPKVTLEVPLFCLGNALSVYLEGLAKATLANLPFESTGQRWFSDFLKHLPHSFPAPRPEGPSWEEEVQSVCQRCKGYEEYPYFLPCAWADKRVHSTLRGAIHTALRAHGLDKVKEEFVDGEVVVHLRCAEDTLLSHNEYGPPGFSLFEEIPRNTTRVTFVEGPTTDNCILLRNASMEHLMARLPAAQVRVLTGGDHPDSVSEDFARLTYAPMLVRSVGSFSLWAGFANPNKVITAKNPPDGWFWDKLDFGENWYWSDAPILTPKVATQAFGKVHLSKASMKKLIIPWLMQH